jgi:hypothetical protein
LEDPVKYLALFALLACSDPVAVVCDDSHFIPPRPAFAIELIARDATQSFMEQLIAGTGDITLDGSVFLTDTLDLAPFIAPTTHTITLRCSGGFTGSAAIVGHLRLSRLRDWELNVEACTFYRGSFHAPYLQQSVLNRVRIQEQSFRADTVTGLVIRDGHLFDADIHIGGANAIVLDNTLLIYGTLSIQAQGTPNSYPGFVNIMNMHAEHSQMYVRDVAGSLLFLSGIYFNSEVRVSNSSKPMVIGGDWVLSDLYVDDLPQQQGCR